MWTGHVLLVEMWVGNFDNFLKGLMILLFNNITLTFLAYLVLLSLSSCFLVVFVVYLLKWQELKIYLINLGYDPRSNILILKIFKVF